MAIAGHMSRSTETFRRFLVVSVHLTFMLTERCRVVVGLAAGLASVVFLAVLLLFVLFDSVHGFDVFAEGRRVGVALVTAWNVASVGFLKVEKLTNVKKADFGRNLVGKIDFLEKSFKTHDIFSRKLIFYKKIDFSTK